MVGMLIWIIVICTAFAVIGAIGEKMMRYGKENGIVKGKKQDEDQDA